MNYSKGISWIDDCRIPFIDDTDKGSAKPQGKTLKHKGWDSDKWLQETIEPHTQGRFPANILVSDDMLNDGLPSGNKWKKNYGAIDYKGLNYSSSTAQCQHGGGYTGNNTYADSGSSSRYYDIDKWFEKLLNV